MKQNHANLVVLAVHWNLICLYADAGSDKVSGRGAQTHWTFLGSKLCLKSRCFEYMLIGNS